MKGSYKIALLLSAAIVAVVLGYYVMQDQGQPGSVTGPVTDADAPPADISASLDPDGAPAARTTSPPSTPAPTTPPSAARPAPEQDPFLAQLQASLNSAKQNGAPAANQPAVVDAAPVTTPETAGEDDPTGTTAATPTPSDRLAAANNTLTLGELPTRSANGAANGDGDNDGENPTAMPTPPPTTTNSGLSPTTRPTPEPATRDTPPATPRNDTATRPTPARPAAESANGANNGANGGRIYTIRAGDTFSSIAQQAYGDESRWVDIAQANPLVDPNRLQVGAQIRLPAANQPRRQPDAVETRDGATTADGSIEYRIKAGDSLSSIAQQFYNDPGRWNVIYEANRGVIRNPDNITAGTLIRIPPAPRGAR